MSDNPIFRYDEDQPRKGRGIALWVVLGLFFVGGIAAVYYFQSQSKAPAAPKKEMVMLRPVPPPPPVKTPPPPKMEPEKIKQEMMEQTPVDAEESKPEDEAPADPGIGTNLTGPGGPDGFGLGKNTGGNRIGGSGKKSASKFGWYAAQVQKKISDAVQKHPVARLGDGVIRVKIWPDPTGRISKARLVDSTGNQKLDTALNDDVLVGLVLTEPPPADLPLPITLRITLKRP